MQSMIPLFGGLPVGPELLIILLVLVLLFGANKIPKLARSTGQAMGEFKKGREEVEKELEEMSGEIEEDVEETVGDIDEESPIADAETETGTETGTETETEASSAN